MNKMDNRMSKQVCVECLLHETRYRCKICEQPVCFDCAIMTDLHSMAKHEGEDLIDDISTDSVDRSDSTGDG